MKIIEEIKEVERVAILHDAFCAEQIVELYLSAKYRDLLEGRTAEEFVKYLKSHAEMYGSCFYTSISVGG